MGDHADDARRLEPDEDEFRPERVKPPLGLMPRALWIEKRMRDIEDAVSRYNMDNKEVPQIWREEYYAHFHNKLRLQFFGEVKRD
jgi:hypothetical protein